MKHIIFYFTGTGNSLWAARTLGTFLEDSETVSVLNSRLPDIASFATVGVVYPVYMHRMPYLVANFIKKLPPVDYLYAVAVNAGEVGGSLTYFRKQLGLKKNSLKSGFKLVSPGNYLPYGGPPRGVELERILDDARSRLQDIAQTIKTGKAHFDREDSFFKRKIHPGLLYSLGYKFINNLDKDFSVNENCTDCGICRKICPVGNLTIENGRPAWGGNCQMCFACIHACPENAIQYGKTTEGLERYRNPEISLADIIGQRTDGSA